MRIGIFGGSFDPVHLGHLLLAEAAREQAQLDEVWFVPVSQQPLKRDRTLSDATHRVQMLELAIGGNEAFRVSHVELDRGGISYTVDTLEALHNQSPSAEFCFLLGADSVRDLPRWREPRRICELATLLIACRPQSPTPDLNALGQQLGFEAGHVVRAQRIDMPQVDLSSSELRERIRSGRSIRYRVTRAVEKYIQSNDLYRGTATV